MSKPEILKVLKTTLFRYRIQYFRSYFLHPKTNFTLGFCNFFSSELGIYTFQQIPIVSELEKDLMSKNISVWFYKIYFHCYDRKLSLKPRIDHLKRTIARLENELKEV